MKLEIVKLRKKIYKNLKEKAMSFEEHNYALKQYLQDQENYSKRKFLLSSIEQLTESVHKSQAIFLGDFHTFDQNIRNVLRIIKVLLSNDKNCVLALEMINSEHQLYIDAYMEGHITDLEFLESIDYHDSWRFPWSHYKLIFELAKEYGIKVVGINTEGDLSYRDEFAAEILHDLHHEFPTKKLLTLYGELHITKDKIPSLLKSKCPNLKQLIVHQNLDEVYWKLIKQNIEQGIVSFSKEEYCIVSAPPWIKYESMIYWYENLCDDPDFDIHEYIIENGKKIFSDDTKDNFLHICLDLANYLKLDIEEDDIEDFNLYDHTNLDLIESKIEESASQSLVKFYQHLIETNYSFRLPKGKSFYCSNYSMNRISYLAGVHVFHHYLDKNSINTQQILNSKSSSKKFILFTLESMFAYFFSKIINPHRKCDMFFDLKLRPSFDSPTTKMALETLSKEELTIIKGQKLKDIYQASLLVGHILGEYLYEEMFKEDKKLDLKKDFLLTDLTLQQFIKIKENLLTGKNYQTDQKRYF